jgi:integrase
MVEKRVTVWVQRFKDRDTLMLQWLDPETGKRKSKSARTEDPEQAERARADLEYELNHGLHKEAARISWSAFRELFEAEYLPNTKLGTQLCYQALFDHFENICNPRRLESINERTLSTFVAGLRKCKGHRGTMQPSTIRMKLCYLVSALNWAVEQKLIPTCPKPPRVKVPKKRPAPVPAEAFERLLARAEAEGDPEMRALLLCGWRAGLRLNEARLLSRSPSREAPWVDLASDRIYLPAELVKAVEDQWVPLDAELRQALLALPNSGPHYFQFISRETGKRLTPAGLGRRVVDLAERAGVRLTMRTLRRGFGCYYAEKVPAQVLQKLMRHSDIRITMAYYANVDDAAERAVRERQCNSSRNTEAVEGAGRAGWNDSTPTADESFSDDPV